MRVGGLHRYVAAGDADHKLASLQSAELVVAAPGVGLKAKKFTGAQLPVKVGARLPRSWVLEAQTEGGELVSVSATSNADEPKRTRRSEDVYLAHTTRGLLGIYASEQYLSDDGWLAKVTPAPGDDVHVSKYGVTVKVKPGTYRIDCFYLPSGELTRVELVVVD